MMDVLYPPLGPVAFWAKPEFLLFLTGGFTALEEGFWFEAGAVIFVVGDMIGRVSER